MNGVKNITFTTKEGIYGENKFIGGAEVSLVGECRVKPHYSC
jgi:hypothetical protein